MTTARLGPPAELLAPADRRDAREALGEAWRRAATERVEIGCAGGRGRTGTALACIAVLDGVQAREAVAFVGAGPGLNAFVGAGPGLNPDLPGRPPLRPTEPLVATRRAVVSGWWIVRSARPGRGRRPAAIRVRGV